MITENSKTNESNKFSFYFTDKLNLKDPNKNFFMHGKTLNLYITTINLKYLLQPEMKNLIFLMDLLCI